MSDQTRIMTPSDAIKQGVDFLVVGRPITKAEDPVKAAEMILEENFGSLIIKIKSGAEMKKNKIIILKMVLMFSGRKLKY